MKRRHSSYKATFQVVTMAPNCRRIAVPTPQTRPPKPYHKPLRSSVFAFAPSIERKQWFLNCSELLIRNCIETGKVLRCCCYR